MPAVLEDLVQSGQIVVVILAILLLEVLLLVLHRHFRGRGPTYGAVLANALSGACLLLALRAALTGAAPPSIAVWLAGALVAHLADLCFRWRTR